MKLSDIKNQEIACKVLNRKVLPGNELEDIADAINFINNDHQPQKGDWYPLFLWDNAGGFGFSYSLNVDWPANTLTYAGARLGYRFETQKEADYFGKQFEQLHKEAFFKIRGQAPINDLNQAVAEVKDVPENTSSYLQSVDAAQLFLELIGTLARKENVSAQNQLKQISLLSKNGLEIIQSLLENAYPDAE